MKHIFRKIFNTMGYTVVRSQQKALIDADIARDSVFMEIYESCKPFTMVSVEKSYALYLATKYIIDNKIPGDFVECGVWRGGQTMIMAQVLLRANDTSRKIYLYDTYTGMTEPDVMDVHIGNDEPASVTWSKEQQVGHNDWCYAPRQDVEKNLISTGYPAEKLVFVEGMVEDTIPSVLPEKIALLRLDTDWYASTYHEMVHAFPRLQEKGVLVVDDYGTWAGSRKAIDQYLEEQHMPLLLNKVGKSGRVAIKF